MKKALTAAVGVAALAAPFGNAVAATTAKARPKAKPKKRVVTTKVTVAGDQASAGQWGTLEVTLVVRKTTTIVGAHRTVRRAVVGLDVPIYPSHTDRSIFINQQALPMLEQEALSAKSSTSIDMISGATFTSQAFVESLQAALQKAQSA